MLNSNIYDHFTGCKQMINVEYKDTCFVIKKQPFNFVETMKILPYK